MEEALLGEGFSLSANKAKEDSLSFFASAPDCCHFSGPDDLPSDPGEVRITNCFFPRIVGVFLVGLSLSPWTPKGVFYLLRKQ